MDKVNIPASFGEISEHWCQMIVGEANGQLFKLAKGAGATNWHKHDDQDELFILYGGRVTIHLRDREIELEEGDLFVVPRGVEHRPVAQGEACFLVVGTTITSTVEGGKPN
jgi:mannose-6-phosphate isomerase-like protein (cupin superfamily)